MKVAKKDLLSIATTIAITMCLGSGLFGMDRRVEEGSSDISTEAGTDVSRTGEDWIAEAKSGVSAGSWTTQDKSGTTVIVEGEIISRESRMFSSGAHLEIMRFSADVMSDSDLALVRTHWPWIFFNPGIAFIGLQMLCCCKSYRDISYGRALKIVDGILSGEIDGLYYVFTVSEQRGEEKVLLGKVSFNIKKDYPYGTVELTGLVVKPEAQGRGLSKILSSGIFKLLPQTNRIILDVACTNGNAIRAYDAFGFTLYKREGWSICFPWRNRYVLDYEYLVTDENSKLQDVAALFEDVADDEFDESAAD